VVGASGLLGGAVVDALQDRHEVLKASRNGDVKVDIRDPDSIADMYSTIGSIDAVACAAGVTPYGSLDELTIEQIRAGLHDKLLGQIELVRQGLHAVGDRGSFTLVSGVLAYEPILTGSIASTVDGAIDAFVRAAAIELDRGIRINAVSATVFEEAWDAYGDFFPGWNAVPVGDAARAFVRSIEGADTGQVIRVGY